MKEIHQEKIQKWYNERKNELFIIAGYAGCGKTTLAKEIPDLLGLDRVQFLAPTGKAALLLGDKASTIHSYLYETTTDELTKEPSFHQKNPWEFKDDLIIVDEVSMVGAELMNDLKALRIPIVGLGDPEQLPPVEGTSTVLDTPDILLTEVFRMDGGLLKLATDIRLQNRLSFRYDDVTFTTRGLSSDLSSLDEDTIILVKFNKTRRTINDLVRREVRGFYQILHEGEKLIVTKNNRESGLMNGSIITVLKILDVEIESGLLILSVEDDSRRILTIQASAGGLLDKYIPREGRSAQKVHEIDYAYAITCHKAQGSEFDRVFVINEGQSFPGHRNWFYTAVTRAKKELKIYSRV